MENVYVLPLLMVCLFRSQQQLELFILCSLTHMYEQYFKYNVHLKFNYFAIILCKKVIFHCSQLFIVNTYLVNLTEN